MKDGDMSDYNTSEVDWGEEEFEPEDEYQEHEPWNGEETSHYSWGREAAREDETWEEGSDSEIDYGGEKEYGYLEQKSPEPFSLGFTNTSNFKPSQNYSFEYQEGNSYGCSSKGRVDILNTHKKKPHHHGVAVHQTKARSTQAVDPLLTHKKKPHHHGVAVHQAKARSTQAVDPLITHKKKSHHYGISSQQTTYHSTQAMAAKRTKKGSDYSFNPFVFTGYSQDPEEYLQWEAEMEYWFRLHKIPKEEKLGCALSMLDGKAYEWWLKEDAATYYTSRAVLDWGTLKSRMYREFTKKYQTTRSVKSTTNLQPSYEHKSTHHVQPKSEFIDTSSRRKEKQSIQEEKIQQKLIIASLFEQQEPLKGKSSNSINPLELMCYKCKQQGHIAKDCPTKRKAKVDDPLTRTSQASACGGNPKSPFQEIQSETIKEEQVGKEVDPNPMVPTHEDDVLRQPEQKLSVITPHEAPKQDSSLELQVSVQSNSIETVQCLSNTCESNSVITHLSFQESFKVVSGATKGETTQHMEKCEDDTKNGLEEVVTNQGPCETYLCGSQAVSKQKEQVVSKLSSSDHNFQNTCLMHLSTAKELEKDVGAKEELDSTANEPNTLDGLQNLQDVASNPMNDHEDHSGEPQEEESLDAHRTLGTDSSTKGGIISSPNDMVRVKTCQYDLNTSITVLTHLSSAKNVEKVSGPKETNSTLKEEGNRNHEECKLLPTKPSTNRDEVVGDTVQIKEKPPDDQPNHKSRGKLLNPYTLQWIDLNYLCVGEQKLDQVLRAKLFEERGYDEVIKSSLNNGQEERRSSLEEGGVSLQTLSLRAVNKTDRTTEACSGQTDHQLNGHSSTTTWDKFLAYLGRSSKWNHSILRPHEEDMNFTTLIVSSNPELDVCALFGWPRSDQKELGCKLNCYEILTHERSSEIWNHANPSPYEEVINFSRQGILNGPNLEASDSRSFQTFVWRPGELLQPLEDPKRFKDFPFDPGISLAF